jgi:hypothetical protein
VSQVIYVFLHFFCKIGVCTISSSVVCYIQFTYMSCMNWPTSLISFGILVNFLLVQFLTCTTTRITYKKRRLKISIKKTEVVKVYNNRHNSPFKIGNDVLKQTTKFCYLESIVSCVGGCQDDIINDRNKALSTKIIIFNSNLKSVLLYAS